MKSARNILLVIVLILLLVPNGLRAQNVLMLVDPGASWHPDSELELVDFLEDAGYDVTVQPVAEVPGDEQASFAEDFDLVYLADSIGSGTVHDGTDIFLKNSPVPLLSQEAYMWDEAAWTGRLQFEDFGDTFQALEEVALGAFTQMDIVNPTHPMAAGLSGVVDVYTDPYGFNFGYIPEMGMGADVIATLPGAPEYATLFVYEPGSALADGTTTPGMRIGMFLGQNVARAEFDGDETNNRWDRLTPEGMAVVRAAFDYATGKLGRLPGDFNGNGVVDAEDLDVHAQYVLDGNIAGDVDGDGDTDIDDRLTWVETIQGSWVGDSNFDGEFNSGDFVKVFTDGLYETGQPANYGQGDWNGDGVFSSGDFVIAFSAGGYEVGARAAQAAVPEPNSLLLVLISFGGVLLRGRRRSS